jgi:mutator protein MutT
VTDNATVIVAAAVIRRVDDGRILISRRPRATHLGGLWEFPGGKVERGESLEDALVREVEEELGVKISVGKRILEQMHTYANRRVHLHFFECRIVGGEPRARSVESFAWCAPDGLGRYAMPEANSRLVGMLRSDRAGSTMEKEQ